MYLNIVQQEQHQNNINSNGNIMSVNLNETKAATSSSGKVDCAKECPCGVPAIPVPDQWLEVMVTGSFKVWHIIFIIIAFVVTTVVVYCCFHRCRIPRTKQEIEADLMRSNIANKFRDYLQELPNEPTTFVEALKKVQEIEEKLEADDAQMSRDLGARKRMGWLKLRAKDKAGEQKGEGDPTGTVGAENEPEPEKENPAAEPVVEANKQELANTEIIQMEPESKPPAKPSDKPTSAVKTGKGGQGKQANKKDTVSEVKPKSEEPTRGTPTSSPANQEVTVNKATPKVRRKRDKPNLSRTKAAHLRSDVESMEHNQLELPPPVSHHHHHQNKERHPRAPTTTTTAPTATTTTTTTTNTTTTTPTTSSALKPAKGKTKARKGSTGATQAPLPPAKHN